MIIDDGKGRGAKASVSESNRLNVSAKSNPRIFYVSRDSNRAFSVVAVDASAAAGDMVFQMKNTSTTRNLIVNSIQASAAENALLKLWTVTGTAAAGTALTAANLSLKSSIAAEVGAMSGNAGAITGLTQVDLFAAGRVAANSFTGLDLQDALILGPTDQIAVEYDTGTTGAVEVTVFFYYEDVDRAN